MFISPKTPWQPQLTFDSNLKESIYDIIRGKRVITEELLRNKTLRTSAFVKQDLTLSCAVRDVIQALLLDIGTSCITELKMSEYPAHFHMEVIIADLLSLYTFMHPEQHEKLQVPLYLQDSWHLGEYYIEHLQLSPSWMGSPMIAFGLVPQNTADHPPLLLFRGTGLPTASGFSLSILTDVNPFASIGAYGLALGKKTIVSWLGKQHKKAHIFGKSLGGSMACLCALSFPDFVEKVMAIGAPGLHRRDLRKWHTLMQNRPHNYPEIHHFWQQNDLIPYFDYMALSGMHYYQIIGGKALRGLAAHAAMAITQKRSQIMQLDPTVEEKRKVRRFLTLLRALMAPLVFVILLFLHACITIIKKIDS